MKENKSGWQFPKALEIIKCKEGSKEFMKERPARRPFGNTVLICEYPIDDTAAEEPNAKLITWRLAKRAARDFLRVSFMPSTIVSAATHGGKAAFRIISRVSLKVSPYWKPRQAGFKVPKYQTWKAPSNICTGSRTAAGVLGGTSIFNERAQTAPQERSYSI